MKVDVKSTGPSITALTWKQIIGESGVYKKVNSFDDERRVLVLLSRAFLFSPNTLIKELRDGNYSGWDNEMFVKANETVTFSN